MMGAARLAFLLSTAALAAAFAFEEKWLWLIALSANTAFGIVANRREWVPGWFLLQLALSAVSDIPALLALAATTSGLAYWDLAAHHRLVQSAEHIFNSEALIGSHYRSLALALAGGSLFGVIALGVPLRLNFVAAVLLALLAVAGIAGLADTARSASS
ncbi:MAG: hypothetical protein BMS9Abin28_1580 [Anaerolineae bacterium]|nr:MAG: hypothetical protein BMS9Abin28_1580 [Anaerolineae bacterium]